MRKSILAKIWYAIVVTVYVLAHVAASGPVIAMVHVLGLWSYPVVILAGFGLNTLVLVILIPPKQKRMASFPAKWIEKWTEKFKGGHDRRMRWAFWQWVAKGGPFVLVLVFTLALGPLTGSFVTRFQGLDEVRAWKFSLISTVIAAMVTVSVYLGFADSFMDFLAALFSSARTS